MELFDREVQCQARLAAEGVFRDTEFEIMAITAGEGNGWHFGEAALRHSLQLWTGVSCFVDHGAGGAGRSVRDLAGVLYEPKWDVKRQGIRCWIHPMGPSKEVLEGLGAQFRALAARGDEPAPGEPERPAPQVGFSADVVFTTVGREVRRILRVLSVDLVMNPARGGTFVQVTPGPAETAAPFAQSNPTIQGEKHMENSETTRASGVSTSDGPLPTRAEMCGYLLEASLSAARLPAPITERVRKQFAGSAFDPAELTRTIADARALLADLTAPGVVQGPGRVHGMFTSEDQFSAAVHDLLGAARPDGLEGANPARLSGIRELYTLMTGDVTFQGGYDPARAQFATTADMPGLLMNAMNKLIAQEWQGLGASGYRWWEPVVAVEHFSNLHDISGVLVGEVTALPSVAEGAPYPSLNVADSRETASWNKYGGYIGLTLEMFERDETHRLVQFPKRLAGAGLRRISSLVGSIFTSGGGVGPNMADGSPVFAAARQNLGVAALSSTAWEAASSAIYNQEMLVGAGGAAPRLALDARYLIVPRGLRLAARQILYPSWEREANIVSENLQRGEPGDVITCPEFSDPNDWAAVADPRLAPGIILGERFGVLPEIVIADGAQNGALFTHDEIRMKARHWLAVCVADYRPLYKANVA